MRRAGILYRKIFETHIGQKMKKRKSDVFAFIGFSIITLVLKAAKQPLTTARSAGEIKA